jgi:hypothetical protein
LFHRPQNRADSHPGSKGASNLLQCNYLPMIVTFGFLIQLAELDFSRRIFIAEIMSRAHSTQTQW